MWLTLQEVSPMKYSSLLPAFLIVLASFAQDPGPQQGPTPSAPGTDGANTPGNLPPSPGRVPGQPGPTDPRQPFPGDPRQQLPEMQRPVFLSGKVVMEDGTPPPDFVTIERICNGIVRPEGYTNSKGHFSFQLGQNMGMMQDASVSSQAGTFGGPGGFGDPSSSRMGGIRGGINERELIGCELRASLAGYRSDVVNLSGRRIMDNPDVGTIILHPLAGVQGFTHSATGLMAPKDAKKAYEKGREEAKKQKWDNAMKEFTKAVAVYPKYAAAWYDMGLIYLSKNDDANAMDCFSKALEADDKFVNPYLQMAQIYAKDNKWQEVADTSHRVTRLNPVSFPQAYFFNAVANYNLQKFDAAEESAREAVKLDTAHRWPKAQHLLGILLAMKNDNEGAAENFRGYLQFNPRASDADVVRKQLSEVEKFLGKTETAQQKP
jgi:predicted negative regulator of RcsB-dependent stress response